MKIHQSLSRGFMEYFQSELIPLGLLENVIEWINNKMDPEDVFTKDTLEEWAEVNGYKKGD